MDKRRDIQMESDDALEKVSGGATEGEEGYCPLIDGLCYLGGSQACDTCAFYQRQNND